jgi:hypothetical protein
MSVPLDDRDSDNDAWADPAAPPTDPANGTVAAMLAGGCASGCLLGPFGIVGWVIAAMFQVGLATRLSERVGRTAASITLVVCLLLAFTTLYMMRGG